MSASAPIHATDNSTESRSSVLYLRQRSAAERRAKLIGILQDALSIIDQDGYDGMSQASEGPGSSSNENDVTTKSIRKQ